MSLSNSLHSLSSSTSASPQTRSLSSSPSRSSEEGETTELPLSTCPVLEPSRLSPARVPRSRSPSPSFRKNGGGKAPRNNNNTPSRGPLTRSSQPSRRGSSPDSSFRRVRWCWAILVDSTQRDVIPNAAQAHSLGEILHRSLTSFCKAFIFQLEFSQSTSTCMWTGYLELLCKRTPFWIKQRLGQHVIFLYLEPAQGRASSNWNHVSDPSARVFGPWQLGRPCDEDGHQKQLRDYISDIRSGVGDKDLASRHPLCFSRYPDVRQRLRDSHHYGIPSHQPSAVPAGYLHPGMDALGHPYFAGFPAASPWVGVQTPSSFGFSPFFGGKQPY